MSLRVVDVESFAQSGYNWDIFFVQFIAAAKDLRTINRHLAEMRWFAGKSRKRSCDAVIGGICRELRSQMTPSWPRWRKRWDSNPRYGFPHAGFQDRFLKPLGHSSCHKGTEPCTKRWAGFTAIRGEASTGLRRTAREYGQFHPRFASVLLRQYRIVSSGGQSVRHGTGFGVAKS